MSLVFLTTHHLCLPCRTDKLDIGVRLSIWLFLEEYHYHYGNSHYLGARLLHQCGNRE